jgi:hypothetical protein
MFNLEDRIAAWRKQMRASGFKSVASVKALELCLRSEIEQQMSSGFNEQIIFNFAVQKLKPCRTSKSR